jgi:hypothetical protein
MHELASVARLRAHIPAPDTGAAFAVLADAIAAETASARRRPAQKHWIKYLAVASAAAVTAALAALSLSAHSETPARSSTGQVLGFTPGPSQGVVHSATELVDYATTAAALAPVFVPSPRDWMYVDSVSRGTGPRSADTKSWQQVGFARVAGLENGRLVFSSGGGRGAQLGGWPGNLTNLYQYLATLPSRPAGLRQIVLANNQFQPSAAFDAIGYLMNDFPLPARFQAELYAVLAGLPGVHFDPYATDAAGRHGVGLSIIEEGFLKKVIIINPRRYTYMGSIWIAVKGHTEYGTSPAVWHVRKGAIIGWTAILGSGIVSHAGQTP